MLQDLQSISLSLELNWLPTDTQWQLCFPRLTRLTAKSTSTRLLLQRSANGNNCSRITAGSVLVSFLNNRVKLSPPKPISAPSAPHGISADSLSPVHGRFAIYKPHTHQCATGASVSQAMMRLFRTREK